MGGTDFWSNGIHLNMIEAAADPAHESWRNIQAMNDLVRELITTDSHLVISALQGNATAGGVMLALAADFPYTRKGIVLNPHYKGMGKLVWIGILDLLITETGRRRKGARTDRSPAADK